MRKTNIRAAIGAVLMTTLTLTSIDAMVPSHEIINVSGSEVRSKTVTYSDLNLAMQKGIERLYSRIRNAADSVCGVGSGATAPRDRMESRSCARAAVSRAVEQVNLPQLKVLHARAQDRNVRG